MLLAAFDHASRGADHGPGFIFPLLLFILGGIPWNVYFQRDAQQLLDDVDRLF